MARWNSRDNRVFVPDILSFSPHVSAAVLIATAAIPVLTIASLVSSALVLPLLSIVAVISAGLVGLFAWCSGAKRDGDRITGWDIACACAFIGFAAGMLSEPEHVMQLFGLTTTAQ